MTIHTIRDGRKIRAYIYRDVKIDRDNGNFTVTVDRYDRQIVEISFRSLTAATARIDALLDEHLGRTTGAKLLVSNVVDGRVVMSLSHSDWRHPGARIAAS